MTSGRFFAFRGPETVYGDGATGGTWYKIRATGIGDPVNRNPAFEEALDISVPTYAVGGPYVVNGTVDALLRFNSFAPLFQSLLGDPDTGKYYLTDVPRSFAFMVGDDQATWTAGGMTGQHGAQSTYYGCGISSMELTFAVREFVRARMTWIGQKAQVNDNPSTFVDPAWYSAPTADNAAVYYNAVIEVDGVPLTAKSVTLRIDRKFDTDYHYVGSPLLQGLFMNGQTELGGYMTLGAGEWDTLKNVITGGNATTITTSASNITHIGTDTKNELDTAPMEIKLFDKDAVAVGHIVAGTVVFTESNRSVTGRNQWDKTVNYRIIVPTSTDFYIEAQ